MSKHITNKISNIFHKFANTKFPTTIQNLINTAYVKLLGLDMKEFKSASSYKCLNDLFTREIINPHNRNIDQNLDHFISPTDSFVTSQGFIKEDTALQIKGMEYSIEELLTSSIDRKNYEKMLNGSFMNFYLSPKDYHRYHASYDCQVTKLIHVPGKLYPVNFRCLNKKKSLFVQNERVILECLTKDGNLFYMVFVGALNVGKMVFEFESAIETNSEANTIKVYEYENLYIKKGQCLGYFKMGSTVLMLWEKDFIHLQLLENQTVRFTDIIGSIK
jgi:phosphatidylserine decarboxylase